MHRKAPLTPEGRLRLTVDLWDPDRLGPPLIRRQFDFDHDQAMSSLGRLADLDADVLVPGHGRLWRGSPRNAVRAALEGENTSRLEDVPGSLGNDAEYDRERSGLEV